MKSRKEQNKLLRFTVSASKPSDPFPPNEAKKAAGPKNLTTKLENSHHCCTIKPGNAHSGRRVLTCWHHNTWRSGRFSVDTLTHSLTQPRFHIPVLCKPVVSGYEVSVDNNGLQSGRARERRHLPKNRGGHSDARKGVFSLRRHLELLWDHYSFRKKARDWVPPSQTAAIMQRRDNPPHLPSHLSTHIHFTKGGLCAYALSEGGSRSFA